MPVIASAVAILSIFVPPLFIVGMWVGARKLSRRADTPRILRWGTYALTVASTVIVGGSFVAGLVFAQNVNHDSTIESSQKARALAERISVFTTGSAFGLVCILVAAVSLALFTWTWRKGRFKP